MGRTKIWMEVEMRIKMWVSMIAEMKKKVWDADEDVDTDGDRYKMR